MCCGDSFGESATAPGQRRTPSWNYEGEERKKKQGERNRLGGTGAEYESEAEVRVRWLFIEMWKLVLLSCGLAPETSPIKLQFTSKDHTVNEMRLGIYLVTKEDKSFEDLGSFHFLECIVGILLENPPPLPCSDRPPKTSNYLRGD